MILYQFPPGNQPDTEEDNIALGFVTTRADAVLLRIDSSNTQDYFELEIVSRIGLGWVLFGSFNSSFARGSCEKKTQFFLFFLFFVLEERKEWVLAPALLVWMRAEGVCCNINTNFIDQILNSHQKAAAKARRRRWTFLMQNIYKISSFSLAFLPSWRYLH